MFTMKHDGGRTKQVEYLDLHKKDVQCWVTGAGTYTFKLSNGECKEANQWFIDGEDLMWARELARERKVFFMEIRRTPQSKKVSKDEPRR